jgi:hypothetical protein
MRQSHNKRLHADGGEQRSSIKVQWPPLVRLVVPGAHFVRPCPVALRRNKALHQTIRPSSLQLAVRSAGERRDYAQKIE